MSIPVYSVVAYSEAGKTTLLEKLVPLLKVRGLRVAVVKHDAHEFHVDKEGKDSWRMTKAGADVSAVCSGSHAAIMENRSLSPEEMIGRIRDVDLILTEGFKQGPWPKIGLLRQAAGKSLPEIDGDYFAVLTDAPLSLAVPTLDLNDAAGLAELILGDMGL